MARAAKGVDRPEVFWVMHVAARPRLITAIIALSPTDCAERSFPRAVGEAPWGSDTGGNVIIRTMPESRTHSRPVAVGVWLVFAGVVGWWAAFSLTMERLHLLMDPDATASCDFSILVQCTANLQSWQGSILGFPNPILGLAGWVAAIVVGLAILAGARFAPWFWCAFAVGITGAFAFVVWLIFQSLFVLGTLCPWCMVTWIVTIPTFYVVVLHLFRAGMVPAPANVRHAADRLMGWVPLLAVGSYAVVAIIAQVRLDVLNNLF